MDAAPAPNSAISTVLERFRKTQERINQRTSRKGYGEQTSRETPGDGKALESAVQDHTARVQADGLSALPQPEAPTLEEARPELTWPVTPEYISPSSKGKPFAMLGLSPETCTRLAELGFSESFAVQTVVIPEILHAQRQLSPDPLPPVLVNSFTGSGKTLAYTAPIIDLLRTRRVPRLRALILLPTKVLIQQVYSGLELLARGTSLRVMALKSDRTLTREAQLLVSPDSAPDVVVCAPGRLVEHLHLRPALLDDLDLLVIDEADRLVGQSFQDWAEVLGKTLPSPTRPSHTALWKRPVQRLVFSATLTRDPAKLESLQIRAVPPAMPKLYVVGDAELDGKDEFKLPDQLEERVIKVRGLNEKPLVLVHELLNTIDTGRVLVFVRSNESAARLSRLISLVSSFVFQQDLEPHKVSGEMRAQDRRKVLRDFAESTSGVLVCTDLISRGIDMHIDYVINYDVPVGPREYVHRVGRTARAGAEGSAWTLVAPGYELKHFWDIQGKVSRTTEIGETLAEPEYSTESYQAALKELGHEVLGTK